MSPLQISVNCRRGIVVVVSVLFLTFTDFINAIYLLPKCTFKFHVYANDLQFYGHFKVKEVLISIDALKEQCELASFTIGD